MAAWLGRPSVDVYNDIHINTLPLNYAYVILNTTLDHIGVYSVSEDCYKVSFLPHSFTKIKIKYWPFSLRVVSLNTTTLAKYEYTLHCIRQQGVNATKKKDYKALGIGDWCPYQRQKDKGHYSTDKNAVYEVYTGEQSKWRILNHIHDEYIQEDYKRGLLCDLKPTLEEYGVYRLDIGRCAMETEVPPVNVYQPLLFFSLIMLSFITILTLIKLFLRRNKRYNDGLNLTAKEDNLGIMASLHFLRGILLILIIFVTAGGGGYPVFSKTYGGLTVANCLLFAYTLTIGLKVPIMIKEDSRKAISKWLMFSVVCVRSFVLLFFGITISNVAPRSQYLGVTLWAPIPCIALSYLVVAILYIISADERKKPENSIGTAGTFFWSWILGAFCITFMVVSIHIFYYIESNHSTEFNQGNNSWVANGSNWQEDVFGEVFNLLRVSIDEPFHTDYYYAFTEGILGIISCILTALIGLIAGVIYNQNEEHKDRMKLWCFWAVVSCITGVILAAVSGPLNFNLWPISSVFLISSMTLLIYASIYNIIEVRQFSSNTITTFGVASIITLSCHLLFSNSLPFYWGGYLDTHFFYLWQSTWVVFLWIVITICWVKMMIYLITKVSDEESVHAFLAW